MAGIDKHHPMGIDVIPPLAPVGYGRIDKGHRGLARPLLVAGTVDGLFRHIPFQGDGLQRMLHGQIVVDPFFQPFHPADQQIGFKGMPGSCRRHRTQSGVVFATDGPHALGRPQQEGQLIQGHGVLGIKPVAHPIPQQSHIIVLFYHFPKLHGQRNALLTPGRFHQRRLRQQFLLVGHIFHMAEVALHKIPILGDGFCNHFLVHSSVLPSFFSG